MHPGGTYCLNHLLRAELAELALVSCFLLYLGNAKSVELFASTIRLAAHKALPKTGKSWFVLNLAKHMDDNGVPVHYLAAEDNERRLKDRVEKVFKDSVRHLTYHAVMSVESPLPRGEDALFYIETIVKGTGAKCVIVDTVQCILNPSAKNKNYEQSVEEYDPLRKLAHRLGIALIVGRDRFELNEKTLYLGCSTTLTFS